jgi:hypothetical protein
MNARCRFLPVTILSLMMVVLALLPSSAAAQDDAALSASASASTVRTAKGDLVTGDADGFAQALDEIGLDGEIMIWLKETGTPRPSAEFLLNLPALPIGSTRLSAAFVEDALSETPSRPLISIENHPFSSPHPL